LQDGIDFDAVGELLAAESEWLGDGRTRVRIRDLHIEVDNPLSVPPFNAPPGVTWPEQVFPAALAACWITTMAEIAERMKVKMRSLHVRVKPILAIDEEEGGFKFERFIVNINLHLEEADEKRASRLIELAHKYCLISKAIKGNVEEVVVPEVKLS